MHSLQLVRERSRRHNDAKNRRLNFFATRVSIFFSWIFVNLGISANTVTFLFFLAGVGVAAFILQGSPLALVLAYVLYRIHLILDVSDGEVARFTQIFSPNGAYWDYLVHSLVYPLIAAAMGIAQFRRYDDHRFLVVAMFTAIALSLFDSAKNNYYRGLYVSGVPRREHEEAVREGQRPSFFQRLHPVLFVAFTFEGLFMAYIIGHVIGEPLLMLGILGSYAALFFLMSILKIWLLSTRGTYPKRN